MPYQISTTVTAAANSYDLVDLATVKAELGISGTASDAQLTRYIAAASVAAAQYCNRVLVSETISDRFDVIFPRLRFGGEAHLQVARWPVTAITSVTENGAALTLNVDYLRDALSGLFYRLDTNGDPTTWGQSPITIVYQGGYADIPSDIEDAVIRMIRARWFARARDPFTRSEDIPGVRAVQYWVPTGADAGNMTPDVMDLLNNYRVPVAL